MFILFLFKVDYYTFLIFTIDEFSPISKLTFKIKTKKPYFLSQVVALVCPSKKILPRYFFVKYVKYSSHVFGLSLKILYLN